jgi:multisubunit Na+/H+ antiporter MnhB subunit
VRHYLVFILLGVIALTSTAGLTHVNLGSLQVALNGSGDLLKVVLLFGSLLATLASILFKRHLLAALALGVAGYSVGGLFLLEPAPDVAMVQFLVETLGTVLIITMLGKISLAERKQVIDKVWHQSRKGLARDVIISALIGVGVGLFALAAATNRPTRHTVTAWHLANSLDLVGAQDVVAAIVTDFRGMDTVIEITVFGLAGLGVLTLLAKPEAGKTFRFPVVRALGRFRWRRADGDKDMIPVIHDPAHDHAYEAGHVIEQVHVPAHHSHLDTPLMRKVAALALPFALMLSVSHILYSGSAPGDGFTAGVVSGIAVALWYVVYGYEEARRRLGWLHPARLIGLGIAVAVLNAAVPLLFGQAFLATTQFKDVYLPAGIHLTSTMVFEIGIFLAVLGGVSTILETIAHPREVETL